MLIRVFSLPSLVTCTIIMGFCSSVGQWVVSFMLYFIHIFSLRNFTPHLKYWQWWRDILPEVKFWDLLNVKGKLGRRGGGSSTQGADPENVQRWELRGDLLTWVLHCLKPRSRFNVGGRRYVGLQDCYLHYFEKKKYSEKNCNNEFLVNNHVHCCNVWYLFNNLE